MSLRKIICNNRFFTFDRIEGIYNCLRLNLNTLLGNRKIIQSILIIFRITYPSVMILSLVESYVQTYK